MIIRVVSFLLIPLMLAACSKDIGLEVGNMTMKGGRYQYIIANTTNKSGDVVSWFDQNGVRHCEVLFSMSPKSRMTVSGHCQSVEAGDLNHGYAWATDRADIAAIAVRIDSK